MSDGKYVFGLGNMEGFFDARSKMSWIYCSIYVRIEWLFASLFWWKKMFAIYRKASLFPKVIKYNIYIVKNDN